MRNCLVSVLSRSYGFGKWTLNTHAIFHQGKLRGRWMLTSSCDLLNQQNENHQRSLEITLLCNIKCQLHSVVETITINFNSPAEVKVDKIPLKICLDPGALIHYFKMVNEQYLPEFGSSSSSKATHDSKGIFRLRIISKHIRGLLDMIKMRQHINQLLLMSHTFSYTSSLNIGLVWSPDLALIIFVIIRFSITFEYRKFPWHE